MNTESAALIPAAPHIKIPSEGVPYLAGTQCSDCGQVLVGERSTCSKCGGRKGLKPIHLGETGHIHTYSIVHRTLPGPKTPFVSAIVALDGGATLPVVVRGVPTDAKKPLFNLPVKLHFETSDQTNKDGVPYLVYYFAPVSGE